MEAAWKRSPKADNPSEHEEDAMASDDPFEGERNEDRAVDVGGSDRGDIIYNLLIWLASTL